MPKVQLKLNIYWIRWFIRFHRNQHPVQMGNIEVEQFLSFLANERGVAVKTQALALNALVFLYFGIYSQYYQLICVYLLN